METPTQGEKYDDLSQWLDLFHVAADAVADCQEADLSGTLPSECDPKSAQFLAWEFGRIVASYALRDQEWRDSLFCEGQLVIEGRRTRIWIWDDIWSGRPLVPLLVGSLLSDCVGGRDWNVLREHYVQMWGGTYTAWGKPLSEVGPQDDLYWAMRIGFADRMLEEPTLPDTKVDLDRRLSILQDTVRKMSLRQVKQEHESAMRWDKLFAELPPTPQKIRSRVQSQLV